MRPLALPLLAALLLAAIGSLHADPFSIVCISNPPGVKIQIAGEWTRTGTRVAFRIDRGYITRDKSTAPGGSDAIYLKSMSVGMIASPVSATARLSSGANDPIPATSTSIDSRVEGKPVPLDCYLADGETISVPAVTAEADTGGLASASLDSVSLVVTLRPQSGGDFVAPATTFLSGKPHSVTVDPPSPAYTATGSPLPLAFRPSWAFKHVGILDWGGTFETLPDKVKIRLTAGSITKPTPAEIEAIGDHEPFTKRTTPRVNSYFSPNTPIPPDGALLFLAVRRRRDDGNFYLLAKSDPIIISRFATGATVSLAAFSYDLPVNVTELVAKNSYLAIILETPDTYYTTPATSKLFLDGSPRAAASGPASNGTGPSLLPGIMTVPPGTPGEEQKF